MAEGIKASTKIDDSRLNGLEDKLLSILDVTDKINDTPIKPN